jgi:hypothetical protein
MLIAGFACRLTIGVVDDPVRVLRGVVQRRESVPLDELVCALAAPIPLAVTLRRSPGVAAGFLVASPCP